MLVNAKWLQEHSRDEKLVILHVGTKTEYDEKHIPGARYVTLGDVTLPRDTTPGVRTLEMLPPDSLRAHLEQLGISNDSRIVVYCGGTQITSATRLALTLDYAGLGAATSVLDGGMPAWVAEGFATTTDVPAVRRGTLATLKTKPVIVTGDWVRDNAAKPGYALVDARVTAFYDGTSAGGPRGAQRKGHIPGVVSVPFDSAWSRANALKSPAELRDIFAKAGVQPGDTIVAYCHIGQQATALIFAARSLGFKTLLYDGSFEDWALRDWPVELQANPKKQRP
jgi:thiosulfate/3-mercaptopyruvate sulfurtransferase